MDSPKTNWSEEPLGDVFDVGRSLVTPGAYPSQEFVHYSIPAWDEWHAPLHELGVSIGSSKTLIKQPTVLVSKLNPRICRVILVEEPVGPPHCASTEFIPYVAKKSGVSLRFYKWFFQSPTFRKMLEQSATGSTNSHVRAHSADTLKWKVPCPTPEEQQRVAAILDMVDEAIAKTETVIGKLKQVRTGLLHDLLTRGLDENGQLRDPVLHPEHFWESKFGRIPVDWTIRPLSQIAFCQFGKAFPSTEYRQDGVRLLRPGNLPPSEFVNWTPDNTTCLPESWINSAGEYLVGGEELIMNLTAQSLEDNFLGRVCMTRPGERCLLNQRLARFRPLDIHLPFLFWELRGPFFRMQIDRNPQGTKVQHIYNRDLEAVLLPVPQDPDEQISIASILFGCGDDIQREEDIGAKLRHVKSGLTSDLLTGRVRVPQAIGDTEKG